MQPVVSPICLTSCPYRCLQLSGTMIWLTKDISEFETNIVSVERLKEYSELETEVSATKHSTSSQ